MNNNANQTEIKDRAPQSADASIEGLIEKFNAITRRDFGADNLKPHQADPFVLGFALRADFERLTHLIEERDRNNKDKYLLNDFLPQYESRLRDVVAMDFIEQHFADASVEDKTTIRSYIKLLLAPPELATTQDRLFQIAFGGEDQMAGELKALLAGGVPWARAVIKNVNKTERRSPWKYVWSVIQNLAALVVAIAVFSVAADSFQVIVFAILIMIYLAVRWQGIGMGAIWEMLPAYIKTGSDDEKRRALEKNLTKRLPTLWIDVVSLFLIWVVALWHLIAAL